MRRAKADTVLPLSEPVRGVDGRMITEIPVPKGATLLLNLRACNTSKALWGEDADDWKPERWLGKLPDEVAKERYPGVYSSM